MNRSKLMIFFALFALCSCASPQFTKIEVTIPNDFKMTDGMEIRNKIPLTAGLFLNPAMINFTYEGSAEPIIIMKRVSFFMGTSLCAGSERMLRNIFRDVVIIDSLQSNLSSQNIDVIVTPEIIGISRQLQRQNFDMRLAIKWNIVSLDGKIVYFNTISGEVLPKTIVAFTASGIEEKQRENMIMLMNDHFLKAQNDIYSNSWWEKQWWKESNR